MLLALPAGLLAPVAGNLGHLAEVPALARRDPDGTALMRLREAQARRQGRPARRTQMAVPYGTMSPYLRNAVLIGEDPRFFAHRGIRFGCLQYALMEDIRMHRWARGGSTITMQLAKNLYLSPEKTLWRKASEIALALALERELPKSRILELYLNNIEWGDGVYGCEAASRAYFGCASSALTPEQAIRLASIIINPRRYGPSSNDPLIVEHRREIAGGMRDRGWLSDKEFHALHL